MPTLSRPFLLGDHCPLFFLVLEQSSSRDHSAYSLYLWCLGLITAVTERKCGAKGLEIRKGSCGTANLVGRLPLFVACSTHKSSNTLQGGAGLEEAQPLTLKFSKAFRLGYVVKLRGLLV